MGVPFGSPLHGLGEVRVWQDGLLGERAMVFPEDGRMDYWVRELWCFLSMAEWTTG
jgi:hypothetical protein